jgi:hypothetical protein
VRIDAVYRNLDENHVIRFDETQVNRSLGAYSNTKMIRFREECNKYRSQRSINELIDIAKTTCTVVVGLGIVNYLVNK